MMELLQPLCAPSTFDFGLPLDFMTDDQEALELAALSEDIFSSSDCVLPYLDLLPPLRAAAETSSCSDKDASLSMVPLETLHQQPKLVDSVRACPSPSSSGTSYRPVSDADGSCGSDCTEAVHSDSPQQSSRMPAANGVKVDVRIGKRKPDVDLDSISDIHERRKQRRLAKNRATAATSRARKREQMSHLSVRVAELEEQNAALSDALAACNQQLAKATSALRPL